MRAHGIFRDPGDLVITTDTATAAYAYNRGVRSLIISRGDAETLLLEAVTSDPHFALAKVALALVVDGRGLAADAHEWAHRAVTGSAGATRRERQHIEVITLVLGGDRERAAVLGREHVLAFPNDVLVAHVLTSRGLA